MPADAERGSGADERGSDIPYAEALGELEAILADLEADAVDVDRLADRVGRAAELIRVCRERIARAQLDVDQIVADLEDS